MNEDNTKPKTDINISESMTKSASEPATKLPLVAKNCDNKEVDKNSPGSATNTVNPGPNHREGVANLSVPKLPDWIVNRDQAISFLEFAQKDYENARYMRTYYAFSARSHGVTNREIGEIFGVAESTVRAMLKRATTPQERG